jgi:hypothetical protein
MSEGWNWEDLKASEGPRRGSNANCPGEYKLAVQTVKSEVDPGKEVTIDIFITGYGQALGSKLSFYPPQDFIDEQNSYMNYGLAHNGDGIMFGAEEVPFSQAGFGVTDVQVVLDGLKFDKWEHVTPFFDVVSFPSAGERGEEGEGEAQVEKRYGTGIVATETKLQRAPVEFHLTTRETAPRGNHNLQFYFTYFDGTRWRADSQSASLVVRNWFQQHPFITWGVAVAGVVIGFSSLVLNVLVNLWNI